ncbi:Inositol 1 [Diplonema papillatum]|nr:Inositol 1 [Diplonema papillatum]
MSEIQYGDYFVLQGSSVQDCLSVEWFGTTCYPVVHCIPKSTTTHGSVYHNAERTVFKIATEHSATENPANRRDVAYGQTIRLFNVCTNLFLASREGEKGEVDAVLEHPRDVRSLVDETGVRRDLWKLLPRHKIREDGERVRHHDQLYIVNLACGLYLNLATGKTPAMELACKMNDEVLQLRKQDPPIRMLGSFKGAVDFRGSAWMILKYEQNPIEIPVTPATVRCLDSVVIFHKECEAFLRCYDEKDGEASVAWEESHADKSTYNVLDLNFTMNTLFTIEQEESARGGGVLYLKRRYRLKNTATNSYLALRMSEEKDKHGKRAATVTTTPHANDPNTLIVFQPLEADMPEPALTRTSFARIQFATQELWLHAAKDDPTAEDPLFASLAPAYRFGRAEKASKKNDFIDAGAIAKGYFEDVLAVRVVPPTLRGDLMSVVVPSVVLSQFVEHWSVRKVVKHQEVEDWRGRRRVSETDPLKQATERYLTQETTKYFHALIRALSNVASGTKHLNVLDDALPHPAYRFQKMLFEVDFPSLLFKTLQTPLQKGGLSLDTVGRVSPGMIGVYQAGFRLVEQMIRGAKDLAIKLSCYIPFLETQLKHELNIASALMQIIADNHLILTNLHQRQLESFCFLIPQYGRSPTYLTLLSACCTCEGLPMVANQTIIVQCLSGVSDQPGKGRLERKRPCSVGCLRVHFPLQVQPVDGLQIKPYTTFPPSTDMKVRKFLQRYERDRDARSQALIANEDDISSSESSLSSADSEQQFESDYEGDDALSEYEESDMPAEAALGVSEGVRNLPASVRDFLYRTKRSSTQSWANYVSAAGESFGAASTGCWAWRCEYPSVLPRWKREWFTLAGGSVQFRKERAGAIVASYSVVEIASVEKDGVDIAGPPHKVRNYGIRCELMRRDEEETTPAAHERPKYLLLCTECMGERSELLNTLNSEARQAEAAIEGTKALSGDPVSVQKLAPTGGKKTASLQNHMRHLLRKQHASRGDEHGNYPQRVTRVEIGRRFDTLWESVSHFIRHRPVTQIFYLEAQLTLFNNLCIGGNKQCLAWVQTLISREIVKEGLLLACEHPLAPAVRAAFTDLAVNLYLIPAYSRRDMQTARHELFLSQLKSAVNDHLRKPEPQRKNHRIEMGAVNEHRFTAGMLRLCEELVKAESYEAGELAELIPPLLKTLAKHAPAASRARGEDDRKTGAGVLDDEKNQRSLADFAYHRQRTEAVSELQLKIMETKLHACKVLLRLVEDPTTCAIVTSVLITNHEQAKVLNPNLKTDGLTTALLSTILHKGHDELFITAIKLLFRNLAALALSKSSRHAPPPGDPAEPALAPLATILIKHLAEKQPEVLIALFRVLDGALTHEAHDTTLAIMKTLIRMVYLHDDEGIMRRTQTNLDQLGVAPLVAVLIESRDEVIVHESLALMIALMHGGNATVQGSLSTYFLSRNDEALFVTLRNRIAAASHQLKEAKNNNLPNRLKQLQANNLHHIRSVLRVLQLFSEGHNLHMQDYLRAQSDNVVSYNLVKESFSFTCVLLSLEEHNEFTQSILVQGFNTLTEFCQGPCKGNQVQLVKGNVASQVTGTLARRFPGLSKEKVNEIRSAAVQCLQSVLEGRTAHDPYTLIVRQTIDVKVLRNVVEDAWRNRKDGATLEVGFEVFVLVKTLRMVAAVKEATGFTFLDTMTGGIEICRDGRLERVFFRIPSVSANLSDETKDELLRSVNRTTSTARISDFYYRAEGLIFEIEYYQKMFHEKQRTIHGEASRVVQQSLHRAAPFLHDVLTGVAFTANFLLVGTAKASRSSDSRTPSTGHSDNATSAFSTILDLLDFDHAFKLPSQVWHVLYVCAFIQACASCGLLADFLISKAPLMAFRRKKQSRLEAIRAASRKISSRQMISWWNSSEADDPHAKPPTNVVPLPPSARKTEGHRTEISKLLQDQDFSLSHMFWSFKSDKTLVFYVCCVLAALLGAMLSPFFLTVHLLAVSTKSPVLVNVIAAVTRHSKVLMLTALLGSVIVYLFTVVAFILFREKFVPVADGWDQRACDTLFGCFGFLLANAVRAGGGVGDLISDHSWDDRPYVAFGLLSDFLFFVIVIVILLNIISGVIIDTFARLREERDVIEDDIKSRCFICGIESTEFDRQGEGFEHHIKHDHNLWLYIYFLHHLMKKETAEFTGQESYVYGLIQRHDLAFFPLNKAIILEGKRDEEDCLQNIGLSDRTVQDKLVQIETKLSETNSAWYKAHQEYKEQVSKVCDEAVKAVVDTQSNKQDDGQESTNLTSKVSMP